MDPASESTTPIFPLPHPYSSPKPKPRPPRIAIAPSSTTAPDPDPAAAALSDLQAQLHDTHTSLASHVEEMRVLEGVFAEHDAIQRVAGVLRVLVEKITEAAGGENGGGGGW